SSCSTSDTGAAAGASTFTPSRALASARSRAAGSGGILIRPSNRSDMLRLLRRRSVYLDHATLDGGHRGPFQGCSDAALHRSTDLSLGFAVHGGLDVDVAAAVYLDVLTLDRDVAVLLHRDRGRATLELDLVADLYIHLPLVDEGIVVAI